jgi:hypothetical protein
MTYNTKCDPLNNNINVPSLFPIPSITDFGLDLSFGNPTIPNISGIPEDILSFINRLKLTLPGGAYLKDIVNDLQKTISAIIANLLGYLNLFLGFYFFVLAIIELVLCVINVLCAIPNPFSMVRRVKKLIRKCIPLFIQICFPFFVFLALLLALLALLLALIEYIIALIRRLIDQLLKNIKRLKYIVQQGNSDAALAIISKISDLLCLFEHVFLLLGAIDTIVELIKTKWDKILRVCNINRRGATDDGCCDAICANFLTEPEVQVDNPLEIWKSRVKGTIANLYYVNPVLGNPYPFSSTMIIPIRNEAVYLEDNNLDTTLSFNNIIQSAGIDGIMFPFFPSATITKNLQERQIPYTADVSLYYDPSDGYGFRQITVTDCVVTNVILDAPLAVISGTLVNVNNPKGYLILDGGSYYDELGVFYTLPFILKDISNLEAAVDGNGGNHQLYNIAYQLKINYDSLIDYILITADCLPSMQLEHNHLNQSMYKPLNFSLEELAFNGKLIMPNISGAISQCENCLSSYRNNITEESTTEFDTCMNGILSNLQTEANTAYGQLLSLSVDAYSTTKSLSPDIQFTTDKIIVTVTPKSVDNLSLQNLIGGFGTNDTVNASVATKFTASPTLGYISDFTYDGYGNFTAELTTNEPGDGLLDIYFDGEIISTVTSPDDLSLPPSIDSSPLTYTFIGFSDSNANYAGGILPGIRRDESDTSTGN